MRKLGLNLEELSVETTELQPAYTGLPGYEGYEPYPGADGFAASILWDTQTHPIVKNTNSSPCIA
jgi:hypothetical protein